MQNCKNPSTVLLHKNEPTLVIRVRIVCLEQDILQQDDRKSKPRSLEGAIEVALGVKAVSTRDASLGEIQVGYQEDITISIQRKEMGHPTPVEVAQFASCIDVARVHCSSIRRSVTETNAILIGHGPDKQN